MYFPPLRTGMITTVDLYFVIQSGTKHQAADQSPEKEMAEGGTPLEKDAACNDWLAARVPPLTCLTGGVELSPPQWQWRWRTPGLFTGRVL